MTFSRQGKLLVAAAAAGAAVVVVGFSLVCIADQCFQGGNHRRKKKCRNNVAGLYNLGNTCFANALLQCLAACPSFELWLMAVADSLPAAQLPLLSELRAVIARLNDPSSEEDPASGDGIMRALAAHQWYMRPESEQDLFELFNVFVTTWEEELTPLSGPNAITLADVGSWEPVSFGSYGVEQLRSVSEIVRTRHRYRPPCAGLLGTELSCRSCGHKNVRHDRFCSLDLVLPKTTLCTEISVESCLRRYFAHELLPNYRCERCHPSAARRSPGFLKKQGISKLPDCLILRIQRVGILPSGVPFKHIDHVHFSDRLCVGDLLFYRDVKALWRGHEWAMRGGGDSTGAGVHGIGEREPSAGAMDRYIYNLVAVVVHTGRLESGHFVAYRRGGEHGHYADPWFYTSDTEVKRVTFDHVASQQAYMLFYNRAAQTERAF